VLAVIFLTPVPTFLVLVLLDSMKLRDPRLNVDQHATTFLRSAFSHSLMTYVILLAGKQAMGFTAQNSSYTHTRCMLISVCVAVTNEAIWTTLAFTWKFPVPMREVLAVPPWGIFCVVYHFLLAKDDFAREFDRLKKYLPVVTAQLVLFYVLLAMSIVFAMIPYHAQLGMIFAFPVVKFTIKHLLWKFSRELDDISADVTICMVEISGSLYQTVCMQYVHNNLMVALIMGMDFLQATVEVRTYMSHNYVNDTRSTLETSFKIVQAAKSITSTNSEAENNTPARNASRQNTAHSVIRHWKLGLEQRSESALKIWMGECLKAIEISWRRLQRRRRLNRYAVRRSSFASLAPIRRGSGARPLATTSQIISVYMRPGLYQQRGGRRLMNFAKSKPRAIGGPLESIASVHNLSPLGIQHAPASGIPRHRRGSGKAGKVHAVLNHTMSATDDLEKTSARHQRLFQQKELQRPQTSRPSAVGEASPPEGPPLPDPETEPQHQHLVVGEAHGVPIDNIVVRRRDQARILEQTLQLLFAAEVLLFVEYMEVFMPILYAGCIGTLWELPNAKYNVILSRLTPNAVASEVVTSTAYAALEFLSFLSVYWFVKKRYGISALYQLAFLLETYWMTLQGKLIGSFIVILNSSTIHQGVDLAFRFNVTAQLEGVPLGN